CFRQSPTHAGSTAGGVVPAAPTVKSEDTEKTEKKSRPRPKRITPDPRGADRAFWCALRLRQGLRTGRV
ncbi:MAG TPA: hypothetical protein VFS21_35490, partial [Roseiflexaceae bacterium]|nr:hypothetical protein [Roseiflexaceae bacterium]